jgi:FixJ family two-component response regulator
MHSTLPLVALVAASETMRDALSASLAARGYGVSRYVSVPAFLASAVKALPACLIVDLASTSPAASEKEIVDIRCTLQRSAPPLPLIVLSGFAETARGGLAPQRDLSILVKPAAPDQLAALVARAIQSRPG